MSVWEKALVQLDEIERYSQEDSGVHRWDARVKVLSVFLFLISLLSFNRYEVSGLIPFAFIPFFLSNIAGIPLHFILKRVMIVMPFAFFMGVFNPLLDREIVLRVGSVGISAGWISFASILIRSFLCVWMVSLLVATTGIFGIGKALLQLKVPAPLVMQVLLVYRYIFVLVEEAGRMLRAREMRSCGNKRFSLQSAAMMIAHLLLRSTERAKMIYQAMEARHFRGDLLLAKSNHLGLKDYSLLLGFSSLCLSLRLYNPAVYLGELLQN